MLLGPKLTQQEYFGYKKNVLISRWHLRATVLWSPKTTILTQITELFCSTYELEDIFWWSTREFKRYIFPQFQNMCSLACELRGLVSESVVLAYFEISLSFARKWSSSLSSPLVMPGSISPSYTVVDSSSDLASPTNSLQSRRYHALDWLRK